MELDGRVALVTGGGSGMGRATARRLTAEGMQVCVVDIDGDAAAAVAGEIGGLAVTTDVSDAAQVDAAFAACVERFGAVDLAYLNAGIGRGSEIGTITDLDYALVRGVNLDGVVYGARAAVRTMRARSDGHTDGVIVATSSIAGIDPFPPDFLYTLTKHAVVGVIRAIGPALAAEGITAHAICPGVTDTNLLSEPTKAAMRDAGIELIAPEEIAAAVVDAATSPPELTGTCWVCHPGQPPLAFAFNDVPGPHDALSKAF